MKKLFLLLSVITLSLYACGQDGIKENQTAVIAKMKDNKITFIDEKGLISQLESALKQSKELEVKLTDLNIEYSKAVDNDKIDIIQLVATNDDSSIQVSYQLEKASDGFRIVTKSSTLVCEGCRSGCSPRRKANGDGYCTKCDYSGASKCVKTETGASFTE